MPCSALHSSSARMPGSGRSGPSAATSAAKAPWSAAGVCLAGEWDRGRQDEHRLVDHRPGSREIEIGGAGGAQGVRAGGGARQPRRERLESAGGDGGHDFGLALEVTVENRLAVVDQPGEPARGDGVPALGFGEATRRFEDEFIALLALALPAFGDRHAAILSAHEKLSTLELA